MLPGITIGINFTGLVVATWMGVYLVTHTARRAEVWFSALAFWSMGGYFLNHLLALLPPPAPQPEIRIILYHLTLFWPRDVFAIGWKGWLLGWLPVYSIIFWFHATLYILPGPFTRRRLLGALSGYLFTLAGILVLARYEGARIELIESPLYEARPALPITLLTAVGIITFACLSLYNLARAARSSPSPYPRILFQLFLYAILLAAAACLVGPLSGILKLSIPQSLTALLLLIAILLAGTGAVQYYSSQVFRYLARDIFASAAVAAVILVLYLSIVRVFFKPAPEMAFIYVLAACLAVISTPLVEMIRVKLVQRYYPLDFQLHPAGANRRRITAVPAEGVNRLEGSADFSVRDVELAFRNLANYAYLAGSPLSNLEFVVQRLDNQEYTANTHIDRGKAVASVLCDAVQLLKPNQGEVPSPAPRSWYPFIILWDAYIENRPNLEIMTRLFISEGTFNRTRKAAIASVAQLLIEMEEKSKAKVSSEIERQPIPGGESDQQQDRRSHHHAGSGSMPA